MGLAAGLLKRLMNFNREIDCGLAVLRGEEMAVGQCNGVASGRRCKNESNRRFRSRRIS